MTCRALPLRLCLALLLLGAPRVASVAGETHPRAEDGATRRAAGGASVLDETIENDGPERALGPKVADRGGRILADPRFFPATTPRAFAEAEKVLLAQGDVAGRSTLPVAAPPALAAILQAYGAPDHEVERGGWRILWYNRVGLCVQGDDPAARVAVLEVQLRDYAYRAPALAGLTYDYQEHRGATDRVYYRDGRPFARQRLAADGGRWETIGGHPVDGVYRRHWDAGEISLLEWVQGRGVERTYYLDKTLARTAPFEDNAWHGVVREYRPDGTLARQIPYRAGRLDGELTTYGPKGRSAFTIVPFRDGERDGVSRQYYPSGGRHWEIPYRDGKKHGVVEEYYRSGRIKQRMTFVDGKLDGLRKSFDDLGAVAEVKHYRDDARTDAPAPAAPPPAPSAVEAFVAHPDPGAYLVPGNNPLENGPEMVEPAGEPIGDLGMTEVEELRSARARRAARSGPSPSASRSARRGSHDKARAGEAGDGEEDAGGDEAAVDWRSHEGADRHADPEASGPQRESPSLLRRLNPFD